MDNTFHNLTDNASDGNWSIITWGRAGTFFVHRGDKGEFPGGGNIAAGEKKFKKMGEGCSKNRTQYSESVGGETVRGYCAGPFKFTQQGND